MSIPAEHPNGWTELLAILGDLDSIPSGLINVTKPIGIYNDGLLTGGTAANATHNTAVITAHINAAPEGSILWFPPARYWFDAWPTLSGRALTIAGSGWYSPFQNSFGNISWQTSSTNEGTILLFTNTTGNAISWFQGRPVMRNFMMIGPGSGDSNGVHFNNLRVGPCHNVRVANFNRGWNLDLALDGSFYSVEAYGCNVCFRLNSDSNQNVFYNTQCEFFTDHGILIGDVAAASRNTFLGGLCQNMDGTAAIETITGTDNHFDGFWFESGVTGPPTDTVKFGPLGAASRLTNAHFASNCANIGTFASDYQRIGPVYTSNTTHTLTLTTDCTHTTLDQAGGGGVQGILVDLGSNRTHDAQKAIEVMYAWIDDTNQGPVTLGRLPAAGIPLRVGLFVHEAFNSDGTDMIRIGGSGNGNRYAGDTDVSTVGAKVLAPGSSVTPPGYMPGGDTITAQYFNGGSEPTTGKALVWMEYFTVSFAPA